MISRQEHNELIRKAGRERMKNIKEKYYHSGTRLYEHYGGIRKDLSEEEKESIRENMKARWRRSRRWTLVIFSFAALLFGFLCYKILYSLSYF